MVCDDDATCENLAAGAACLGEAPSCGDTSARVCDVECTSEDDCSGAASECIEGRCRGPNRASPDDGMGDDAPGAVASDGTPNLNDAGERDTNPADDDSSDTESTAERDSGGDPNPTTTDATEQSDAGDVTDIDSTDGGGAGADGGGGGVNGGTGDTEGETGGIDGSADGQTGSTDPLLGTWREVARIDCGAGEEVPAEPAPINEVVFSGPGYFSVTWTPFEFYNDYEGTYVLDQDAGTIDMTVISSNYLPPDADLTGTFVIEQNGDLIIEDVWFGTDIDETVTPACGHRLVRE